MQSIERANFSSFQEILSTAKRFKTVTIKCQRDLAVAQTLLERVEPALRDSIRKTFEELSG